MTLAGPGVACKKDEPDSGGDDSARSTPQARKKKTGRLPAIELSRLDEPAGFLAGGAFFAAVRAGTAQDFLRQIPLPGKVTRELAQARRELGFDPLTDDVLERFAIPEDAVISMTLGRPVGVESRKQVATDLRSRDDRFLMLVSRVLNERQEERWTYKEERPMPVEVPDEPPPPPQMEEPEGEPIVFVPPKVEAPLPPVEEVAVEVAEEPPPPLPEEDEPLVEVPGGVPGGIPGGVPGGVIGGALYDSTPPPISAGERRDVEQLLRGSDAIALQFRFHIPTDEPRRIFDEFRTRADASDLTKGAELCRGQTTEFCLADGRGLILGHTDGKAAVLDVLMFTARHVGDADAQARRDAIAEALKAPSSKLDALSKMAGHASLYLDAAALVEVFEHEQIGTAVRALTWEDGPRASVERRLRESESLRRMFSAPRLFDGLLANAHHERDRTQLQVTWLLHEDQQALASRVLAPPPVRVPVPSIESLCKGALFCARSRGVPQPQALGTQLALGVYGSERALEDALRDTDEMGALLMFVSTWPNALGWLGWHLPLAEARGPEAALVRGALDAVGRVQGLGLSVHSFAIGPRFQVQAEYAAYARVPVDDINLVGTALALGEQRMTTTTVEGIDGEVKMLRIPENDAPAVLMTRNDPEPVDVDGKEIRHGWLTVVEDPERLAWLLGLPTDDGDEPYAYAEIPDLWRFVATVPEAAGELGFARTWATDRAMRASLELEEGQPRIVVEVALSRNDGSGGKDAEK